MTPSETTPEKLPDSTASWTGAAGIHIYFVCLVMWPSSSNQSNLADYYRNKKG